MIRYYCFTCGTLLEEKEKLDNHRVKKHYHPTWLKKLDYKCPNCGVHITNLKPYTITVKGIGEPDTLKVRLR